MTNLRPREYKAQRLKVTEVANHDFGSGYFSAESTVAISEQRFEAQARDKVCPCRSIYRLSTSPLPNTPLHLR